MTAILHYKLTCDHPGCSATFNAEERRADVTRARAVLIGWTHGPSPGYSGPAKSLDYCPLHVAELGDLQPKTLSQHARPVETASIGHTDDREQSDVGALSHDHTHAEAVKNTLVAAGALNLEPIPQYGTHMNWDKFVLNVNGGMFDDYDGFAKFATTTECSDILIVPSDLKTGFVRPLWATHVVWFNR